MPTQNLLLRDALRVMLLRDLRALDREIAAYPDDESPWLMPPGISNSTGTLVLHIAGNLRHFLGSVLGETGYARNREAEFSTKGLSREQLRAEVQAAMTDIERALDSVGDDQLAAPYPLLIVDRRVRTAEWLIHLAVHLGYHLGQIDYHRRLLSSSSKPVDSMSVRELPDYHES